MERSDIDNTRPCVNSNVMSYRSTDGNYYLELKSGKKFMITVEDYLDILSCLLKKDQSKDIAKKSR